MPSDLLIPLEADRPHPRGVGAALTAVDPCEFCSYEIPRSEERCPHCARPGRFRNVLDASDKEERQALEERYQVAIRDAQARGCEPVVRQFESAILQSRAVIARPMTDTDRLAASDRNLYATHYQWLRAGVRLPSGEKWDRLRLLTDVALFGESKDQVRFAALSLDGVGLDNYGECSLVLRDEMIAHRATAFEENSVKFMERHEVRISDANNLPRGYRARWNERHKLCTSKLAASVEATIIPSGFPELLLKQGKTSDDDQFVEVHVWGSMSLRTIERVIVRRKKHLRKSILNALEERLGKYNVPLQVV
jgi:hypothetical protein